MIMTSLKRSISRNIPNIFTMLNLMSGCLAILLSFHDIALAGLTILLAGFFDFADGMAARIFNAYSEFGKQLDSLADMVSFGVAPSFILYQLIKMSLIVSNPLFSIELLKGSEILILSASFLPALFASIRLAKFNTSGSDAEFSGLPSPASGIFFASLGYILLTTDSAHIQFILLNTSLLLTITIIITSLMVTTLPMFTIKFRNLRFADNKIRYFFAIPSLIIFIYLGIKSIPIIILWYIILSIGMTVISKMPAGSADRKD
jgi:CDP-diacylglycerol---serine O-phosphatidyltransferase